MAQMGFFRRPQLAGNTLNRVRFAKVRGSIRRSDADGVSTVPYFPGLVIGHTLLLTVTAPPSTPTNYTVVFTGVSFQTVISDINAILGSAGKAIDEDGVLAIQTNVEGGVGRVDVTGGTGSKFLGFDTTFGIIRSTGGDMPYTPEGRVNNLQDTTFLGHAENLTQDSVQKALSRLSSNSDVLYFDLMRQNATMQRLPSFSVAGDGKYITPAATTRIFTGGPVANNASAHLSASSTKEDLSPYFFIFDTVTKQPAAASVVAVTRGLPGGDPAYASASAWTGGGSTGQVLGVDLIKQSAITVSSISENRLVTLGTALDATVVAGDLVEFVGATNFKPSNNNGLRWLIEQVVDTTHIVVRPMSFSELAQMGQSFTDSQPLVELNGSKDVPETFGTISVHTGYATSHVNLIVRPPLPPNGTYEVWACQPLSIRESRTWNQPNTIYPQSVPQVSGMDTEHNTLLSTPTVERNVPGAGSIRVHGYYVRWHGRTCYVPQVDIATVSDSAGFIYWDESLCATSLVSSATTSIFNGPTAPSPELTAAASAGTRAKPIVSFTNVAGSVSFFLPISRIEGDTGHVVTVGHGGDFPNIRLATDYINKLSVANSETSFPSSNSSHYEIVVLSDTSMLDAVVEAPYITIRGANPGIRLVIDSSTAFSKVSIASRLTLSNITLKFLQACKLFAGSGCTLVMDNVNQDMTTDAFGTGVAIKAIGQSMGEIRITNSNLVVGGGINWGGTPKVTLRDSVFTYASLATVDTQLFSSSTSAPSASATFLNGCTVDGCSFIGFPANHTYALFAVDNSDKRYEFNNTYFNFNTSATPVLGSLLLQTSSNYVTMRGVTVDGQAGAAVIGTVVSPTGTVNIHAVNCKFDVKPSGGGSTAGVIVDTAIGCTITCFDSLLGNTNNIGLRVNTYAAFNNVTGPFTIGITGGFTAIVEEMVGNYVNWIAGTNTNTCIACIDLNGSNAKVIGNTLTTTYAGAKGIQATSTRNNISIVGNYIAVSGASTGISMVTPTLTSISGNVITNSTGDSSIGVSITNPTTTVVSNNVIKMFKTATSLAGDGITVTSGSSGKDIVINGNKVFAANPLNLSADTNTSYHVTGNDFSGDNVAFFMGEFIGNRVAGSITFNNASYVTGNSFIQGTLPNSTGGVTLSQTSGSSLIFSDNQALGIDGSGFSLSYSGFAAATAVISNNVIVGKLTSTTPSGMSFMGNSISGTSAMTFASGARVSMSGNRFLAAVTLAMSDGSDARIVYSSNLAAAAFTVTVGTSPNVFLTIGQSRFSGAVITPQLKTTSGICEISGSIMDSTVTMDGDLLLSGNSVTGALSTTGTGAKSKIVDNTMASTVSILADSASTVIYSGNSSVGNFSLVCGDLIFDNNYCDTFGGSNASIVAGNKCVLSNSFILSTLSSLASPITVITGCQFSGSSYSIGDNASVATEIDIDNCTFANATLTMAGDIRMSNTRITGALTIPALAIKNSVMLSNVRAVGAVTVANTTTFVASNFDTNNTLSVTTSNSGSDKNISMSNCRIGSTGSGSLTITSYSAGITLLSTQAGTTAITATNGNAVIIESSKLGDTSITPSSGSLTAVILTGSKFLDLTLGSSTAIPIISACSLSNLLGGGAVTASGSTMSAATITSTSTCKFDSCLFTILTMDGATSDLLVSNCKFTSVVFSVNCNEASFNINNSSGGSVVILHNIRNGVIESCNFSNPSTCLYVERCDLDGTGPAKPSRLVVNGCNFTTIGSVNATDYTIQLGNDAAKFIRGAVFSGNTIAFVKNTSTTWACVFAGSRVQECVFVGNRWSKTIGAAGLFADFNAGSANNVTSANRNIVFSGNLGITTILTTDVYSSSGSIGVDVGVTSFVEQSTSATVDPMMGLSITAASGNGGFGDGIAFKFTI